jgi:hypothetical protein
MSTEFNITVNWIFTHKTLAWTEKYLHFLEEKQNLEELYPFISFVDLINKSTNLNIVWYFVGKLHVKVL